VAPLNFNYCLHIPETQYTKIYMNLDRDTNNEIGLKMPNLSTGLDNNFSIFLIY